MLTNCNFLRIIGALALLTACASNDAQPAVPPAAVGTSLDPVTVMAIDSTKLVPMTKADSAKAKADSAKGPPVTVPAVPGRNTRDSLALVSAIKAGRNDTRWPVKTSAPLPGSILPGHRIVAFYGNPLSKKMGVLGELPKDEMLAKLDKEVAAWNKADPSTPVQPALQLIVVVAQGAPGRDGMYRLRMPDTLIEKIGSWAAEKHAVVFLDVQVGLSNVQTEVPRLEQFLKRPNFFLAIDPEFSMKTGAKPGTKIGTMSSADVNWCIDYLAHLVDTNHLPPKILIVHRFTRNMLTGSKAIKLDPRVQIIINMDGWGGPWLKFDSYRAYVESEPVQFTGFKLFYHNDTKKGEPLLTPGEVLRLTPRPVYIQYQ
jgi:hypothetical protein